MFLFGGAHVDDREIEERFVRAIGADGRNRRHKATAVELRLNSTRRHCRWKSDVV